MSHLICATVWGTITVLLVSGCSGNERSPQSDREHKAVSAPRETPIAQPGKVEAPDEASAPERASASPETSSVPQLFLNTEQPVMAAVVDFDVRGQALPGGLGASVADRFSILLPSHRFLLVERSQLKQILAEHDLRASDVVEGSDADRIGALVGVSHLVLGSITQAEALTMEARLVDVSTGIIVRQSAAEFDSTLEMGEALEQCATVLAASDAEYAHIEDQRHAVLKNHLEESMARYPRVERDGEYVVITVRTSIRGKTELQVIQEIRQRMRDQFAAYCRTELGLAESKQWLMDYCKENEDCQDATTIGSYKMSVYRIPFPSTKKEETHDRKATK